MKFEKDNKNSIKEKHLRYYYQINDLLYKMGKRFADLRKLSYDFIEIIPHDNFPEILFHLFFHNGEHNEIIYFNRDGKDCELLELNLKDISNPELWFDKEKKVFMADEV